ncbi:MAG: glycosyltransferase, partial [Armatimonadota bacterium]
MIDKHTHLTNKAIYHNKKKITLCMIVQNEENFLEDCLKSVTGLVDEIIIVDTGSQDNTKQIAEKFGAKIFDYEWDKHFSKARNFSLDKATGDWILVLDADEKLEPEAIPIIMEAVNNPVADAYDLYQRNILSDDSSNQEELIITTCRIFKNNPLYRYRGRAHEDISYSIALVGGIVCELPACIIHEGYRESISNERAGRKGYRQLLEEDYAERPDDLHVLFHLGKECLRENDFENGIKYLQKSAEIVNPSLPVARIVFTMLSSALLSMGKTDEAEAITHIAERKGILSPEILLARARALSIKRDYKTAIDTMLTAKEISNNYEKYGDNQAATTKADNLISACYFQLRDYNKSIEYAKKVNEKSPNNVDAKKNLAMSYMALSDAQSAEKYLKELVMLYPDDLYAKTELARCYEMLGKINDAMIIYQEIINQGIQSAEIYRRFGICAEELNNLELANSCFEIAVSLEPNNTEALVCQARVMAANGRIQDSLNTFAKAIESNPCYANSYFCVGDLMTS